MVIRKVVNFCSLLIYQVLSQAMRDSGVISMDGLLTPIMRYFDIGLSRFTLLPDDCAITLKSLVPMRHMVADITVTLFGSNEVVIAFNSHGSYWLI